MTATKREIEELLGRTYACMETGRSEFPGMNYEDGVRAACEFILGDMNVTLDDVLPEAEEDEE